MTADNLEWGKKSQLFQKNRTQKEQQNCSQDPSQPNMRDNRSVGGATEATSTLNTTQGVSGSVIEDIAAAGA